MRRSARFTLLLAACCVLFVLITRARFDTVARLSDQGSFDKYPHLASLLLAGQLPPDRAADVSPAYLRLVALLQGSPGLDLIEIRSIQIAAITAAAALCGVAAGLLGGAIAATAAVALVLGNRAALVNATELEPETLILVFNSIAVVLLSAWQKSGRTGFLTGSALALGLSAITRPTALAALLLVSLGLLMRQRPGRAKETSAFLLVGIAPVALLVAANLLAGRPAVIMDPGTVFYEGMNPLATGYGGVQPRIVNDLERITAERDALHITYRVVASRAVGRDLSKQESNRYWTRKAVAFADTYPFAAVRLLLRKAALALNSYEAYDLATMIRKDWELQQRLWVPFGVVLGFGLIGVLMNRAVGGPLGLMTLGFALPLVLFYVTARQRNALLPSLAVLGGLGAAAMMTAWNRRRKEATLGAAGFVTAVALLSAYPGQAQREDRHAWLSAFAAQELFSRARSIGDPRRAVLVRAHAATWLTSDIPDVACTDTTPAAVNELKKAHSTARLFDLAVILTRCGQWEVADKVLVRLEREGYQPRHDTRAPSSIAYHRARAHLRLGRPPESFIARSLGEAPGDPDVLALRASTASGAEAMKALQLLDRLHDPFTRDLALAQAYADTGRPEEAKALLARLNRTFPQWQRTRQLATVILEMKNEK